jgi:putative transposase
MTGSNSTGRSKLGTKRHMLTDNEGIPLSVVISAANTRNIKLVTDVVDNAVAKRHISSLKTKEGRKRKQHLCLAKAYSSNPEEQTITERGDVSHLPYKRKRGEVK